MFVAIFFSVCVGLREARMRDPGPSFISQHIRYYKIFSTKNEHFNYSAYDADSRPSSEIRRNELMCPLCDSNKFFIAI